MNPPKIGVLGLWHQGLVGAACLAEQGYDVFASDPGPDVVAKIRGGRLPVSEPGLDALVAEGVAGGKLQFVDDMRNAVRQAEFVFLMFDTPVDENDRIDLSDIYSTAEAIAPELRDDAVVYMTAQVPVGTSGEILATMRRAGRSGVAIAYSPENLRLGQAIDRYRHPPLPVIGTDDDRCFKRLAAIMAPFSRSWQRASLVTAEMLKHALNGFLGVSICFANELGNLCDFVGADGARIAELLRIEPRVGPKAMLMPGLGFAGGTLARDMTVLRNLGDKLGIETRLLDGAWDSNQNQNRTVVRRLNSLLPRLDGARICVLGLTYKPDTSTLRRSAALEVIDDLTEARAVVTAHDPGVDRQELAAHRNFLMCDDAYAAAEGTDALVLMTPWTAYRNLDFSRLRAAMRGTILFDTANIWSADEAARHGFVYLDIGRGRAVATGKGGSRS